MNKIKESFFRQVENKNEFSLHEKRKYALSKLDFCYIIDNC